MSQLPKSRQTAESRESAPETHIRRFHSTLQIGVRSRIFKLDDENAKVGLSSDFGSWSRSRLWSFRRQKRECCSERQLPKSAKIAVCAFSTTETGKCLQARTSQVGRFRGICR